MKKRIFALLLTLCMVLSLLSVTAWADGEEEGQVLSTGITDNGVAAIGDVEYATLAAAVNAATDGQTITLLEDVTNPGVIYINNKKITLNMNDHTVTSINTSGWNNYFYISNGGGLDVTGTGKFDGGYGTFYLLGQNSKTSTNKTTLKIGPNITMDNVNNCVFVGPNTNAANSAYGVEVDVYGKLTGIQPIYVHGNVVGSADTDANNAKINIHSTAEIYITEWCIYLAGYAETTIEDGAKIAASGQADTNVTVGNVIQIAAGELTINGGTLTGGTTEGYSAGGNGSITAKTCVAVYIKQHSTALPTTVTINGGTFNGYYALMEEVNKADKVTPKPDLISIQINGGTFTSTGEGNAAVSAASTKTDESSVLTITGGVFSSTVDSSYIASGKSCIANTDSKTQSTCPYAVGVAVKSLTLEETATATYGTDLTLTATTEPTSGYTNPIVWTSSDTGIATVDANGVVTPVKAGTTKITATVDNQTATCDVTVNQKETTMTLTPSTTSLEGGGTVTLTLDRGEAKTTDEVEVTCSDTSITVTPNGDNTYTATLPNATVNYTFTAKLTSDCYEAEDATATVSVTRYVAATTGTTTTTTNKTETTTETLPTETGETANTQVGEEAEPVEVVSTETVTDPETGTVTTTTEKSDGSTTVVEEKTDGTVTTTDTTADGAVKIVEEQPDGTVTTTDISVEGAVKEVEAKPDGTITTTDTAVNGVEAVTVEAPGEQIKATVTIPETVESAVVTIPVSGELTAGMVAMDADTGEIIMLSALTEDGLSLKLDSSRNIVLVDNSKSFDDVPSTNWASDAVAYVSAHNILVGTSDDSFTPNATLDRRTALTGLARQAGIDTTGGDTWYEQAVDWAKETGISDGSNLESDISREQLATLLYRAAGSPEAASSDVSYTDADQISSYAADAIAWATENGILTGNPDGSVNPTGTATRAQFSTVIQRFATYQVNN